MAEHIVLLNQTQKEYIILNKITPRMIKNMLEKVLNAKIWNHRDEISTRFATQKYLCNANYIDITIFAQNKLEEILDSLEPTTKTANTQLQKN